MKTIEMEEVPPNAVASVVVEKQIASWDDFEEQAKKLKLTAETLTVTSVSQVAEMKLARVTRLTLKDLRVAVTHRHKKLKESVLEEGRKIDAGKNRLLALIEPLEERLLLQETFAEREMERKAAELRAARIAEITPYLTGPLVVDLGLIAEVTYQNMLADMKSAHDAKLAREKAEQEEIERKAAEAKAEQERIRAENEKLRKEAEARDAEHRKEKAKMEAALAESNKAKLAAEKAAKDAKDKAEREAAAAKAEKDRLAAAEKAKKDKEEAERLAAEEAAASAPDRDKVEAFIDALLRLPVPAASTKKWQTVCAEIGQKRLGFANWIKGILPK